MPPAVSALGSFAAAMVGSAILVPWFLPGGYGSEFNGSRNAFWLLVGASIIATAASAVPSIVSARAHQMIILFILGTSLVWAQQEMAFDGELGLVENCGHPGCVNDDDHHIGLRVAQLSENLFRSPDALGQFFQFDAQFLTPRHITSLGSRWTHARCNRVQLHSVVDGVVIGYARLRIGSGESLVLLFGYRPGSGVLTPISVLQRDGDGARREIPKVDSHYYPQIAASGLMRAYEGTALRSAVLSLIFIASLLGICLGLVQPVLGAVSVKGHDVSRVSAITILGLLVLGCHGDYVIRLPNGYFLAHVTSKANVVAEPGGRAVIGPTVDKYAVKGDIVVGSVAVDDGRAWFILDTRRRHLRKVPYREWRSELRTLGLNESEVVPPSRLHALSK